jgi:hypothetical protein
MSAISPLQIDALDEGNHEDQDPAGLHLPRQSIQATAFPEGKKTK